MPHGPAARERPDDPHLRAGRGLFQRWVHEQVDRRDDVGIDHPARPEAVRVEPRDTETVTAAITSLKVVICSPEPSIAAVKASRLRTVAKRSSRPSETVCSAALS
ncbi:hypothetical protein [Dietzia kunjamensis]|uniref:hypothetical protein n=1 Tax=Dietzia kunjamensis TaxID=322509 RepID=UPI00388F4D8F